MTQLVLCGDGCNLGTVPRELGQNSCRAHQLGASHNHRLSRLRFEIEVPGYAVDRWWAAGDN